MEEGVVQHDLGDHGIRWQSFKHVASDDAKFGRVLARKAAASRRALGAGRIDLARAKAMVEETAELELVAAEREDVSLNQFVSNALAGELEERTRRVAGRYAGAGLVPGDRVLFSTATSVDLVVAHVAAYRAGLVVDER